MAENVRQEALSQLPASESQRCVCIPNFYYVKNLSLKIHFPSGGKGPQKFFFCVLEGGFRAGMNLKGKLVDYNSDISNFDEVVIGSPVWNGRFPPAINSVLSETDLSNKKLTFLFYSGSGDNPKVLKKIYKNYKDANVVVLKEPKTHLTELSKIESL